MTNKIEFKIISLRVTIVIGDSIIFVNFPHILDHAETILGCSNWKKTCHIHNF